jgi:hypothetical protein
LPVLGHSGSVGADDGVGVALVGDEGTVAGTPPELLDVATFTLTAPCGDGSGAAGATICGN